MSKKETLIREYFALKHEFDINNNAIKPCPAEPSPRDISSYSMKFKIVDLEDKIASVKYAISAYEFENKKNEYFKTPEGSALYNEWHNKINLLREERENTINNFKHIITTTVNEYLGEDFTCNAYTNEIIIGIKNPKNDGHNILFGHQFEIRWCDTFTDRNNHIEINYPTFGSFTLDNENRIKYLNGMVEFLNNKNFQDEIKFHFVNVHNVLDKIENEINTIQKKINNPF